MHGSNSEIEKLILRIQSRKAAINKELMEPLIRNPEDGPAHIELLSFPGFLPVDYN